MNKMMPSFEKEIVNELMKNGTLIETSYKLMSILDFLAEHRLEDL